MEVDRAGSVDDYPVSEFDEAWVLLPSVPSHPLLAPELLPLGDTPVMRREDEVATRSQHAAHLAQSLQPALLSGYAHEPLVREQRSIEAGVGVGQRCRVADVERDPDAALAGDAAGAPYHRGGQVVPRDVVVALIVQAERRAARPAAHVENRAVPAHVPVHQPALGLPQPHGRDRLHVVPGVAVVLPRLSHEVLVDCLRAHGFSFRA